MSGRDLDGSYRTEYAYRRFIYDRRAAQRAAGLCINGSLDGAPSKRTGRVHGPANPASGKCDDCDHAAKKGRR